MSLCRAMLASNGQIIKMVLSINLKKTDKKVHDNLGMKKTMPKFAPRKREHI